MIEKQLYFGRLSLQPSALIRMKITDRYSLHKIMCDLYYSDIRIYDREESKSFASSRIFGKRVPF